MIAAPMKKDDTKGLLSASPFEGRGDDATTFLFCESYVPVGAGN
jgi:hypothetical protein